MNRYICECVCFFFRLEHGGKVRMKPGLKKCKTQMYTQKHTLFVLFLLIYVFLCTDSCNLTVDPNTANRKLCLSEGNRKVVRVREDQHYLDHLDRFEKCEQVLSVGDKFFLWRRSCLQRFVGGGLQGLRCWRSPALLTLCMVLIV